MRTTGLIKAFDLIRRKRIRDVTFKLEIEGQQGSQTLSLPLTLIGWARGVKYELTIPPYNESRLQVTKTRVMYL